NLRVLDSIREDGAKLVELSVQEAVDLRAEQPGVRIVPVVYYYPALAPRLAVTSQARAAAAVGFKIVLKVISQKDGRAIAHARVVAFTNFLHRVGAEGTTNSKGEVRLNLGASNRKIERLYIYSQKGLRNITLSSGMQLALIPIDLAFIDCLRFFYGNSADDAGKGVKLGVIDTGISAEPDLRIDG